MNVANETRAKLVQTALRSIYRTSFEDVGVAQIAQEAGVPKGSFYHWFPSKEALGAEVIAAFAEAGHAMRAQLLAADGRKPLERLHDYFSHTIAVMTKQDFGGGCLLGAMGLEMAGRSAPMREALVAAFERWEATLREVLAEAARDHALPPGLDPGEAAAFILNAWEGALLRMKVARSAAPLELFMRTVFGRLLQDPDATT